MRESNGSVGFIKGEEGSGTGGGGDGNIFAIVDVLLSRFGSLVLQQ